MKRTQDVLYSCKNEVHPDVGDRWRITKFIDGNVESSYQTTYDTCDCPAGVRPSCRHRQMLPQMIAADIVNTEFFWDFDLGRAVTFDGTLKSNIDAMNELAMEDVPPVGEAQHTELCTDEGCPNAGIPHVCITKPHSPTATTTDFDSVDEGSISSVAANKWRRL